MPRKNNLNCVVCTMWTFCSGFICPKVCNSYCCWFTCVLTWHDGDLCLTPMKKQNRSDIDIVCGNTWLHNFSLMIILIGELLKLKICLLMGSHCFVSVYQQPLFTCEGLFVDNIHLLIPFNTQLPRTPSSWGPRLNKKDGLTRYGDFHVKDKTAVRTSYL